MQTAGTPCGKSRRKICRGNVSGLERLGLPVGDVALLGGEGDADLGDGAAVEAVLLGVAFAVYLVERLLYGLVVLQLHDIDASWHLQRDVGASLGGRLLGADG